MALCEIDSMVMVDVVILSYAKTAHLQRITQQAIDSLFASEDPRAIRFGVIVVESNRELHPFQYGGTTTIYPDAPFGYHRYLNLGIRAGVGPFVCLCNNDLIFERGWASEILNAMERDPLLMSASPYCPEFHKREGFPMNVEPRRGYGDGILIGWCIFVRRSIFGLIGELDERFEFWYCDHDYARTLRERGIKHCLISTSFVKHLSNQSHETLDEQSKIALTERQRLLFEYKWEHKSRLRFLISTMLFDLKSRVKRMLRPA